MFALSTAWNSFRHKRGEDIIEEIVSLGFSDIELNFCLTEQIVDEIFLSVKQKDVRVVSLHNYCPIPNELKSSEASPDYYPLSCLDEDIRKKGIIQTARTIETAARFGVDSVVIHAGRVEMSYNSKFLVQLYEQNLQDTIQFKDYGREMIEERNLKSEKHLDRLLLSLEELLKIASKYKIVLGIENRFYFQEIPDIKELTKIFKNFKGAGLGYWHDIGHAIVQERLGLLDAKELLLAFHNNLIGLHIHDVIRVRDHKAPLMGDVDFSNLKEFAQTKIIKVLEIHRPVTAEEIKRGKEYLEGLFKYDTKTCSSRSVLSTDNRGA